MGVSKYDYQHITRHAVTIGKKGKSQTRFTYKKIESAIRKIEKRSREYSQKYYGKNADFPRDIGMSPKLNKFTREVKDFLHLAKNDKNTKFTKHTAFAIERLMAMSEDIKVFRQEFYGQVASHYGVNMDRFEVKKALDEGKFFISYKTKINPIYGSLDPYRWEPSDPAPLVDWIVKNIPSAQGYERLLDTVVNVNYLRAVIQAWNLFGDEDFIEDLEIKYEEHFGEKWEDKEYVNIDDII